jgi:hypothetical protein
MKEYHEKVKRFGLTPEGPLHASWLDEHTLYFCYGNERDPALFEATWEVRDGVLVGNQSRFRWEPKTQVIWSHGKKVLNRVCNIKSPVGTLVMSWRLERESYYDAQTHTNTLEDVFGGHFVSCVYQREQEDGKGYWVNWRVLGEGWKEKQRIWMRGLDHPLMPFNVVMPVVNDYTVDASLFTPTIVIIRVEFEDGSHVMEKYPITKQWVFEKAIRQVTITDGLSYDWIVNHQKRRS